MIDWTHTETFTDPSTGSIQPKWFISEVGGSRFEWSAHDSTIKSKLPDHFWLPVFTAKAKNLRQDIIDGSIVFLIGFGADDSDSSGRMMLVRHTIDRDKLDEADTETLQHAAQCTAAVAMFLAPHGFDPNKSLWDTPTRN
ncbi:MAG: hypothetical protein V4733_10030 [Verrucomicrobiota bacterium]